MIRLLFAFCLTMIAMLPARADGVTDADRATFETIIRQQLQAFAADNGAGAFQFAAPIIKNSFGTPDNFMAMVKRGYQPIYRNREYSFGKTEMTQLGPAQHVTLQGEDGKTYEAVYTMQLQPDGTWKISGCYLKEVPGVGA